MSTPIVRNRRGRGATDLTALPLALMVRPHSGAGSSVVEHVTFNHVVAGSIPARLTNNPSCISIAY